MMEIGSLGKVGIREISAMWGEECPSRVTLNRGWVGTAGGQQGHGGSRTAQPHCPLHLAPPKCSLAVVLRDKGKSYLPVLGGRYLPTNTGKFFGYFCYFLAIFAFFFPFFSWSYFCWFVRRNGDQGKQQQQHREGEQEEQCWVCQSLGCGSASQTVPRTWQGRSWGQRRAGDASVPPHSWSRDKLGKQNRNFPAVKPFGQKKVQFIKVKLVLLL